jgi:hypothetical protein
MRKYDAGIHKINDCANVNPAHPKIQKILIRIVLMEIFMHNICIFKLSE